MDVIPHYEYLYAIFIITMAFPCRRSWEDSLLIIAGYPHLHLSFLLLVDLIFRRVFPASKVKERDTVLALVMRRWSESKNAS